MHCVRKVNEDIYYVGGCDRRLELFENVYPIPNGITYNSYLIMDEKKVLMDTVDRSIGQQFLENIECVLGNETLDYLVIQHMEPDHCSMAANLLQRYPALKIVGNAQIKKMLNHFFELNLDNYLEVKENDTLNIGRHTLKFISAPMVHWPEVMMTYDEIDKILFSADAFGSFGTMNGNLFDDEVNFKNEWLSEARRYYTNIVGKYGPQVLNVLKKASTLDIQLIAPLHGPLHRSDIGWYVEKYQKWASYEPEEKGVMIVYGSVYGNTENAANVLANELSLRGVSNIKIYDVSKTHPSYLVSEAFRCSHLVMASITYNSGIFVNMEHLLHDLKAHNLQNRTVGLIENGSWACTAGKQMKEFFESMKNMRVFEEKVTMTSSLKEAQQKEIEAFADALVQSMGEN